MYLSTVTGGSTYYDIDTGVDQGSLTYQVAAVAAVGEGTWIEISGVTWPACGGGGSGGSGGGGGNMIQCGLRRLGGRVAAGAGHACRAPAAPQVSRLGKTRCQCLGAFGS